MTLILQFIGFLLWLFILFLIGRLVFDWVQFFARDWRPRGVLLVIAEAVYTVTDPPLRFLRRLIPPLRLGQIQLDLAFIVLFFGASLLSSLVGRWALYV
ncbi:YggT family protein [Promicromonospora thailandica]|uniref:YggT family protein n=1 Tax=Promicromonospora thailandica TaxID=765201 RepID=A0A9X2JVE5_9MICO|nr:YggT family protein [Promicromonospora thailandica]MCP2264003.1 YggT family protein [Promicromonospora thailandica]BFF17663.1 YggT family protein [Promicromonospora thailandica]